MVIKTPQGKQSLNLCYNILMSVILKFFDKLEDRVRGNLSRVPVIYAIIGGVAIVLFWRGIWGMVDIFEHRYGGVWFIIFNPFSYLIVSTIALLVTGLFVSFFIGDRILLSGLKHEKKVEEKTEAEVRQEEEQILVLSAKLDRLVKEVEEIKNLIKK